MIALLLVPALLLATLAVTRRALEPECPNCSHKSWAAHSTQLQCEDCGWTNGRPAAAPVRPEPAPVAPQYEICFHG
jgi:ribosomal protein S27AE